MASKKAKFDPKAAQKNPVIVTTKHRGVFQGDLVSYDKATGHAVLKQSRCCVAWRSIRGFITLAFTGPNKHCRISPAAPSMEIPDVTSVIECTPEAAEAWQAEPWNE